MPKPPKPATPRQAPPFSLRSQTHLPAPPPPARTLGGAAVARPLTCRDSRRRSAERLSHPLGALSFAPKIGPRASCP